MIYALHKLRHYLLVGHFNSTQIIQTFNILEINLFWKVVSVDGCCCFSNFPLKWWLSLLSKMWDLSTYQDLSQENLVVQ